MARLKGCVLPVVGEGEQLLILGAKSVLVESLEDEKRTDRGRSAPSLVAQGGELGSLAGVGLEEDTGGGIEEKPLGVAGHEPAVESQLAFATEVAVGVIGNPDGSPIDVFSLEDDLPSFGNSGPGVGH